MNTLLADIYFEPILQRFGLGSSIVQWGLIVIVLGCVGLLIFKRKTLPKGVKIGMLFIISIPIGIVLLLSVIIFFFL